MARSQPFTTIAARSAQTRDRSSGFDYLRLGLAVSIVVLHSGLVSYGFASGMQISEGPARPLVRFILPAFFALSGYLVAGSLERSRTVGMFLGLRVLRIYPALAVEVLLSAFVLGPLFTRLPLGSYFSDHLFLDYLLNTIGDVHFSLPGVFDDNPLPRIVNGQLWTIPFELYCYIVLAGIAIVGLKKWPVLAPIFVILVTLTYAAVTLYRHGGEIVRVEGALNGALLIATFLAGVSIFSFRHLLPWTPLAMVLSATASIVLLGYIHLGDFFAPFPVAYTTVYLGLLNPDRRWLRGADYSYGIFLYGFAIQQAVACALPEYRNWALNLAISLPTAVLVAAASWHIVEKPAQRLKPLLKRWEDAYLWWRQGKPVVGPATTANRPLRQSQ